MAFTSKVSPKLSSLLESDEEMRRLGRSIISFIERIDRERCDQHKKPCDIEAIGSVTEGAVITRWFSPLNLGPSCLSRELELDLFCILGSLAEGDNILQAISDRPGYLRIAWTHQVQRTLRKRLKGRVAEKWLDRSVEFTTKRQEDGQLYVDPYKLRQAAGSVGFAEAAKQFARKLQGELRDNMTYRHTLDATRASSCQQLHMELQTRGLLLRLSVDHVPAVHLSTWPEGVRDWVARGPRAWPPPSAVRSAVDAGLHVIPKSSRTGDTSSEFCYSFASAERILAATRTQAQAQVYFVFKALFYQHFHTPDMIWWEDDRGQHILHEDLNTTVIKRPHCLSSYIAKTTMFWESETYSLNHWGDLLRAVISLLTRLQRALADGHLDNYFLPDVNVLDHVPKVISIKANYKINLILENINAYVAGLEIHDKVHFLESDTMRHVHQRVYDGCEELTAVMLGMSPGSGG